ncbi:hypothetical protein CVT26_011669 [Gymnopilus dilepis]|uniref:F-box domain-containing protein n=1 Tax=Gymnopilus dilepis TaxID=231916 RepID=A0A409W8Y4_9AGAR|nr:hypothetical protein CVT26_011669 [Gymnopilus dilepis]
MSVQNGDARVPFFSRLPPELVLRIFECNVFRPSMVEMWQVLTLMAVCSYWRDIAMSHRKWWTSLRISLNHPSEVLKELVSHFTQCSGNLPLEVIVDGIQPEGISENVMANAKIVIQGLQDHSDRVQTLLLQGDHKSFEIFDYVIALPHLETLDIPGDVFTHGSFDSFLNRSPCDHLQRLRITGFPENIKEPVVKRRLEHLSTLTHLDLEVYGLSGAFTEDFLQRLDSQNGQLKFLPHLQSLKFRRPRKFPWNLLAPAFQSTIAGRPLKSIQLYVLNFGYSFSEYMPDTKETRWLNPSGQDLKDLQSALRSVLNAGMVLQVVEVDDNFQVKRDLLERVLGL